MGNDKETLMVKVVLPGSLETISTKRVRVYVEKEYKSLECNRRNLTGTTLVTVVSLTVFDLQFIVYDVQKKKEKREEPFNIRSTIYKQ